MVLLPIVIFRLQKLLHGQLYVSQWSCVASSMCRSEAVWPALCVSEAVWPALCVTVKLCGQLYVSQWSCVASSMCHSEAVWPALCVTVKLCGQLYVSQWSCVASSMCHSEADNVGPDCVVGFYKHKGWGLVAMMQPRVQQVLYRGNMTPPFMLYNVLSHFILPLFTLPRLNLPLLSFSHSPTPSLHSQCWSSIGQVCDEAVLWQQVCGCHAALTEEVRLLLLWPTGRQDWPQNSVSEISDMSCIVLSLDPALPPTWPCLWCSVLYKPSLPSPNFCVWLKEAKYAVHEWLYMYLLFSPRPPPLVIVMLKVSDES